MVATPLDINDRVTIVLVLCNQLVICAAKNFYCNPLTSVINSFTPMRVKRSYGQYQCETFHTILTTRNILLGKHNLILFF